MLNDVTKEGDLYCHPTISSLLFFLSPLLECEPFEGSSYLIYPDPTPVTVYKYIYLFIGLMNE
jgi:hypothetical protein